MIPARVPLFGALTALLLIGAACSSSVPSATAEASESTAATASPSMVSAFDLQVGDCFNTADISTVDKVEVVDCEVPHVYEVFGLSDYEGEGDAFPGEDGLSAAADEACRPAFEDYVGITYDESTDWNGTFVNPSEETWAEGDREIICVLHTRDKTEVAGSAEGTAR